MVALPTPGVVPSRLPSAGLVFVAVRFAPSAALARLKRLRVVESLPATNTHHGSEQHA